MGNQESQDMKTNYMHVNSQKNLHQKQQLIPHVTSSNPTFQHINFEPQLNKQSTGQYDTRLISQQHNREVRLINEQQGQIYQIRLNISEFQEKNIDYAIKRKQEVKNQHYLTVERVLKNSQKLFGKNLLCQQPTKTLTIYYEKFRFTLDTAIRERRAQNLPFNEHEVQKIIYSVSMALDRPRRTHGDISPSVICYADPHWKLIDHYFLDGGLSAYQKIMEQKDAFLSPSQMQKNRMGQYRQSPQIDESDDIFALGMTCLEIMTLKPSRLCYNQIYIRFEDAYLKTGIQLIKRKYSMELVNLVLKMLEIKESNRITWNQIRGYFRTKSLAYKPHKISLK